MFSKFKHISVEGCDATGKSTLIKLLADELDYTVVKGSDFQIAEQGVDKMFEYMMNIAKSEQNLIIDRDFVSNLVYAPLFDKNMLEYDMVKELMRLKENDTLIIYLYANINDVKSRLNNRGDDYIKTDSIETILNNYDSVINFVSLMSNINIVSFNTSKMSQYEIYEYLIINNYI